MREIDEAYETLIQAEEFVKNFKDERDFVSWLKTGNVDELECALKVFETAELYWHCIRVRDVIKWKQKQAKHAR